jgi:hypothetical protein
MDLLVDQIIKLFEDSNTLLRQICQKITEDTNLSWETLRTHVKRAMQPKEKAHGNQLLTDLNELALVGTSLTFDFASIPLSHNALLEIVCSCFLHNDQWDGSFWFRGFLSRHSNRLTHIHTQLRKVRAFTCK